MDAGLWRDILHPDVSILEKIIRPILVYFFLIAGLRLAGKRELAQLNAFDLVVLLTLSNTVQNAIIGNDNSVGGGLIGAVTLLAINYLVVRFLFKHRRLDEIVEGKSIKLIDRGKIVEKNLARELLTHPELWTVLHRQGFSGVSEVEQCVLEPGGTFAVQRKEPPRDEIQYAELVRRLESIDTRLASLAGGKDA